MSTLILNTQETEKYLNVEMAVETVDFVFHELGAGRINMPPKTHTDMSGVGHEAWCNAMPAYVQQRQVGGIKWIGGFGQNREHNLPYIMGVIVLTDPATGYAKAIMDARLISDYRTGASAAVFSRYLSAKNLKDILIVGAGAQGRMAARCLGYEHPDAGIHLYDLDVQRIEEFINAVEGTPLGNRLHISTGLEETARKAGLIVMLTTAKCPFFKNEWIQPGTTVLGMGSYQQVEDDFALSDAKIITDSWEQAKHRGELKELTKNKRITDSDLYCELGQIVSGNMPGREHNEEKIFGLPIGIGAYDVAIADIIYEKATAGKDGLYVNIQQP